MKFDHFADLPKDHPFDYQTLCQLLDAYSNPRDKIKRLLHDQDIIRIKKGLYILSAKHGGHVDPKCMANLIHGPSYISLEYAMSYWQIIPERVHVVTSVTCQRKKSFTTPVGRFEYQHLHARAYAPGIMLESAGTCRFMIGSREKVLLDKLAFLPQKLGVSDMGKYLESDLRVDMQVLGEMNSATIASLAANYTRPTVQSFGKWFKKFKK